MGENMTPKTCEQKNAAAFGTLLTSHGGPEPLREVEEHSDIAARTRWAEGERPRCRVKETPAHHSFKFLPW